MRSKQFYADVYLVAVNEARAPLRLTLTQTHTLHLIELAKAILQVSSVQIPEADER